jgi:flagellar assembly factor FliW
MSKVKVQHLGELQYEQDAVLFFPDGIPAFEQERTFILAQDPATAPLAFLQSTSTPSLCFLVLPVLVIDHAFRLALVPEDLEALGFDPRRQPVIGKDALCLAIVDAKLAGTPTANLLAPVVINLQTRVARQCIQDPADYSHRHELLPLETEPACS